MTAEWIVGFVGWGMASVFFVLLMWRMQRHASDMLQWEIEREVERDASVAAIMRLRATIEALRERLKQE
jgi:hypothetical protein